MNVIPGGGLIRNESVTATSALFHWVHQTIGLLDTADFEEEIYLLSALEDAVADIRQVVFP